ncbi:VOC family protein [Natronoflexus pectinivorans]|uniref:3-demethylubiquinone-9 3-methyltransferase n=1 Tax=Natronoflexus pectinivorans TaxID=682526 RepID=A0A4R2GDI6_9BACT|nr:VOC family protein [Natronoflexus pectinivorans]TCO05369.1 3-demethylubiquinone-9 3-methyltransferase [Natronoflexus pectinivorans]
MKQAIQPYLHFNDNCIEAMKFYQSIFDGELEVMTVGDSPAKEQFPKELYNQVMHASLTNENLNIMASDMCCTFCFIRTPIPDLSGHFLGLHFFQK